MQKLKPFNYILTKQPVQNEPKDKAGILVALCFDARTKAHFAHLQATSYAVHIALNEFYDNIIDLTDSFAESYQGRFGIISNYHTGTKLLNEDGHEMIKELREWIDVNRYQCGNHSELQNEIDSILTQCNSTIYKLTNLS